MKAFIEHVEKYAFSNVPWLRRLSEPLKELYGIDIFWMHQIDVDGAFSLLTNHRSQTENWIENGFFKTNFQLVSPKLITPSRILAEDIHDPAFLNEKKHMQKAFNMHNDCMFFKKPNKNTVLEFGFASTLPKNKLKRLALGSPEILDQFIDYFLEESTRKRQHLHENAISILPYRNSIFETGHDCHQEFLELEQAHQQWEEIMEQKNGLLRKLTKTERRCVMLYVKNGLTACETAKILHRSPRTIEAHFEHIRAKLSLPSKRALINLYKTK